MRCPVCENELSPVTAGEVVVDVCANGCGGIWFDNFELSKLDGADELAGDFLVTINVPAPGQTPEPFTGRRHCPKCAEIVMMRHFFSPERGVEVDECPNCGGYWLDAGELAQVREEHRHALHREVAALARDTLESTRPGDAERMKRARTIDAMLRFAKPIRFQRTEP